MGDTPDTAQRLEAIRTQLGVWYFVEKSPYDETSFLLDHIDTLTAKLAEVEAERDSALAERNAMQAAMQKAEATLTAMLDLAQEWRNAASDAGDDLWAWNAYMQLLDGSL
jgi:hypothetical protein